MTPKRPAPKNDLSWLADCARSTRLFGRAFMPDAFTRPFSVGHDELFRSLDNPLNRKVLIMMHRGAGKTTIMKAFKARSACFGLHKFHVPISASEPIALQDSENLKDELLNNPRIVGTFGDLKGEPFAKEYWKTATGFYVTPRGAGQQVRGLLRGNDRPDLVHVDDLENRKDNKSEVNRQEIREWFFSDLMPIMDIGISTWRFIVSGTPTDEDSLIWRLAEDPAWTVVRFPLCNGQMQSLNPSYMSDEQVQALAESFRRQGMIDAFYREYMLEPAKSESQAFHKEYFRYYNEADEDFKKVKHELENVVLVDPAKTVNPKSAHTSIGGFGYHWRTGRLYLRDLIDDKLHPDEALRESHKMAERLKAKAMGWDVNGLNDFATWPIRAQMSRMGADYEFITLPPKGKKEDRVRALIPMYREHMVFHNKAVCAPLEAQLLSFPKARRWDCMDMTAYIVPMLAKGGKLWRSERLIAEEVVQFGKPERHRSKLTPLEAQIRAKLRGGYDSGGL